MKTITTKKRERGFSKGPGGLPLQSSGGIATGHKLERGKYGGLYGVQGQSAINGRRKEGKKESWNLLLTTRERRKKEDPKEKSK